MASDGSAVEAPAINLPTSDMTTNCDLCFFAIGDFGKVTDDLLDVASAMGEWGNILKPAFVLGLGDNFYPRGVRTPADPLFKSSWSDVFLGHESLRVPWKMVLGNHDYMGNPEAQIQFSSSELNQGGLWQMPGRNYKFTEALPSATVEFFALDTNGCQGHVRRSYPDMQENLFLYKAQLEKDLAASTADCKIVFAHHPLFTKSRDHGTLGRCLRSEQYNFGPGLSNTAVGYGLEDTLATGGVTAYFSGHEHLFQVHKSRGVAHFVCGSSGAAPVSFYGGEDPACPMDWYDKRHTAFGFVVVTVSGSAKMVTVRIVDSRGNVLKTEELPFNRACGLGAADSH